MAIRMKEWGMLAAPGQPAHVRTQGLYGWERVGRSVGEGLSSVLAGGWNLAEQVNSAGELAEFSEQLKGIGAEVREELQEADVRDWDYSWKAAINPRIQEAVQGLSPASRGRALELAQAYSAQSSIEARRDREVGRVDAARRRWQQQVDSSIEAGQEEQAVRWLEAGRGVFVPEEQMPGRLDEARSRARCSRLEARLSEAPMEALSEMAAARASEEASLPLREEESRRLEQSCARARRSLRQELALRFSEHLRAGEEVPSDSLEQAARAGIIPAVPSRPEKAQTPSAPLLSSWCRWLDSREDGEEGEQEARLALALAPLPLEHRRMLLQRLERMAHVPAADRRALSNQLFELYHSGALGCPGDAEAQSALLSLQKEGATLLAEQGAEAVSAWVAARRAGGESWVCFDEKDFRNQ